LLREPIRACRVPKAKIQGEKRRRTQEKRRKKSVCRVNFLIRNPLTGHFPAAEVPNKEVKKEGAVVKSFLADTCYFSRAVLSV
jgi:hypothetical protein